MTADDHTQAEGAAAGEGPRRPDPPDPRADLAFEPPADLEDDSVPSGAARLRPRPVLARAAALPGPGLHRHHRLHRPGQLGDQHRRRFRVRLHAALGRLAQHADAHLPAAPLGQAGHRHRSLAGRQHPHAPAQAGGLAGRGDHRPRLRGDRPRRVPRRSARLLPAVRPAALDRRAAHGRHRLRRDPRPAVPPAGAHDRRVPRHHRRLLHHRAVPREAGLGGRGAATG